MEKFFSDENRVFLSGRLTRDPESKVTPKKIPICKFTLAVNHYVNDKNKPLFITINTFGELAEECNKKLKKGKPVRIEGRLTLREWSDSYGAKHRLFEIVANKVELFEKNISE